MLRTLKRGVEASLAVARDARASHAWRSRVRTELAYLPPYEPSEDERAAAGQFVRQFSRRHRNLDWHSMLAVAHARFDAGYVPEDIYYVAIHPALNPRDRHLGVADKNGYERLGLPFRHPETVARIVRGKLVGTDFRPLAVDEAACCASEGADADVVLKRANGSRAGLNIEFVPPSELRRALTPRLGHRGVDDDWVVQRVVRQCESLGAFNTESANTLRIMTYRSTAGLRHVSSVLRMGRAGSRVDNRSTGGVTCGIDAGLLRPVGHLGYERIEAHPDSGIRFAGFRVPAWREAVEACLAGHEAIPAMDLVSWDVAIDADEQPTLIELNVVEQGLRIHQLENGPLPPDIVAEWAERTSFWMVGGLVIRKPLGD